MWELVVAYSMLQKVTEHHCLKYVLQFIGVKLFVQVHTLLSLLPTNHDSYVSFAP